jgi:hypothetical protein
MNSTIHPLPSSSAPSPRPTSPASVARPPHLLHFPHAPSTHRHASAEKIRDRLRPTAVDPDAHRRYPTSSDLSPRPTSLASFFLSLNTHFRVIGRWPAGKSMSSHVRLCLMESISWYIVVLQAMSPSASAREQGSPVCVK